MTRPTNKADQKQKDSQYTDEIKGDVVVNKVAKLLFFQFPFLHDKTEGQSG